jgi:hypothetical protein
MTSSFSSCHHRIPTRCDLDTTPNSSPSTLPSHCQPISQPPPPPPHCRIPHPLSPDAAIAEVDAAFPSSPFTTPSLIASRRYHLDHALPSSPTRVVVSSDRRLRSPPTRRHRPYGLALRSPPIRHRPLPKFVFPLIQFNPILLGFDLI